MSEATPIPASKTLVRRLGNRWQIPLLLVSGALFGWGLWRLRPQPPEVPFAQRLRQIDALRRAELYTEASESTVHLLSASERTADERRQLYRALADIIYDAESRRRERHPVDVERMIQYYAQSAPDRDALDAPTELRLAKGWEWLDRPWEAIKAYRAALSKGARDSVAIRRRILELQIVTDALTESALAEALEQFIQIAAAEPDHTADVVWAAHHRIELFLDSGEAAQAEAFLESLRAAVVPRAPEQVRNQFEYLLAWTVYRQGRYDEAERLLRSLRNRMTVRDETDAASGWLLGRIIQLHDAPEVALSVYDDVLAAHFEGPYVTASKLGRAECLAALARHAEAQAAYEATVAALPETATVRIVDADIVRASVTRQWDALYRGGELATSLAYLRIAVGLVPADDVVQQAVYTERLADLLTLLAKHELATAAQMDRDAAADSAHSDLLAQARAHLLEAGELYLRLSDLKTDQETESAAAVWKAADVFDQAGNRERSIAVLEEFLLDRPQSTRVPEALLRLGHAYQALHQYRQAIERYQRAVTNHPRTPSAVASLVPMAECYMALGPEHSEDAKKTLLAVLVEDPNEPPLITPEAREFRDALFKIADLYMETQQYDKAIVRLEEARKRYPDDRRIVRARYQLAEAYRLSAAAIRDRMTTPESELQRDTLIAEYRRRLQQAFALYNDVIAQHEDHPAESVAISPQEVELEAMYAQMSYLYRADCLFDEQTFAAADRTAGYEEAIRLYNVAAWRYRSDPIALSAYVQMIHAYLRLGDATQARATLERARWILRGMPDDPLVWRLPGESKQSWEEYLAWLGNSPTFRGLQ